MKRMLLVSLVVGLVAGQAFADPYEMDVPTAALLTHTGTSDNDTATLVYVGYNPGTNIADGILNPGLGYGASMQYAVGFVGDVADTLASGDHVAWMAIGLGNNFAAAGLTGSFDSYVLPIANDNNQLWQYKLYVIYQTGAEYSPDWVTVAPGNVTTISWATSLNFDGNEVVDLGFVVRWDGYLNPRSDGTPQDGDRFHTSVVPVPAAMLLGLLGLGTAGLKLRKRA